MSDEILTTEAFWTQPDDILLALPRDEFKDKVSGYYLDSKNAHKIEVERLKDAVRFAESKLNDLRFKELKFEIDDLQKANAMSFFDLALNLTLAGIGGIIAKKIATHVLGKILRNRLLIGTTKIKGKIPLNTSKSTRKRLKRNGVKLKRGKRFFKTTAIKDVNLDPDSWESILLEEIPDFIGSRSDETLQSSGDIKSFQRKEKSISATEFFGNKITALTTQLSQIDNEHSAIINVLQQQLNTKNDSVLNRQNIIETIRMNEEFIFDNNIYSNIEYNPNDIKIILSQPLMINAILVSNFFSLEILPAQAAKHVGFKDNGSIIGNRDFYYTSRERLYPAKPTKPKANPLQNKMLVEISKEIFIPEEMSNEKFTSFYEKYSGVNKYKPQVELIRYFQKIVINANLQSFKGSIKKTISLLRMYEKLLNPFSK